MTVLLILLGYALCGFAMWVWITKLYHSVDSQLPIARQQFQSDAEFEQLVKEYDASQERLRQHEANTGIPVKIMFMALCVFWPGTLIAFALKKKK
jgi:hypothetical protein